MKERRKAVLLLSGGLDSTLAGKMMKEMGIDVYAFNASSPFCRCTPKNASCSQSLLMAKQIGVPLKIVSMGEEFLDIVRNPRHGWGRGVNPCIDCRILLLKRAREYAQSISADFFISGEVLGQRPKSQHLAALRLIEEEAGLEKMILRPLSALLLEPTIPETRGWVDRNKLLSVSGRSRKPQIILAEKLGIKDYACPAGGCLLTDPVIAARVKEALSLGEFTKELIPFLQAGRHFRLPDGNRFIVGRNEKESVFLLSRKGEKTVLEAADLPSAAGILWRPLESSGAAAAGIILYYSKEKGEGGRVRIMSGGNEKIVTVRKISAEELEKIRI